MFYWIFYDYLRRLQFFSDIPIFIGFFCGHVAGFGPQNGQDYVVIFFVLSGFVITWSVDRKKEYHFGQYLFDRLIRLWSVVIPALALGLVLDYFGRSIHPQTYVSIFSAEHLELKVLLSGLFLHESWFLSIRPGTNGPFWSLSYEFFYYMIFGTIALLPTLKSKVLAGLTFCIIAGPKILILFPCWLMGYLSYLGCKKFRLNSVVSLVLLLICGFSLYSILGPRWSSWSPNDFPGLGIAPLFYSAKFLDDYSLAVLIGVFLISASRWFTLDAKPSGWIFSFIRNCSKCSFSLYAIHFPLMAIGGALLASGHLKGFSHLQGTLLVFGSCCLFALLFEFPLKQYRKLVLKALPFLSYKCGIRY